jgi:uncharacterized protein (DUF58 family)
MARRTFLPMAIGLALLIVGLVARQGAFLALAVPPILYTCMSIVMGLRLSPPTLRVRRTLARHRIIEGEEIDVTVDITSGLQSGSQHCISIVDWLPEGATLTEGENQFLGPLAAGQSVQIAYRARLPRGRHSFAHAQVTSWPRWGLANYTDVISEESVVVVEPRVTPLGAIAIRPRRTRAFAGTVKANLGGQGLDFFGCRSYVAGDDIRRINWRAYARQDTLVINEYELERLADVSVVLDARLRAHYRLGAETTFDHAVRAAGSLASHFLSFGNIVGLLVYGNIVQWVFPGVGKTQERRILDSLSTAYAAEKEVFEDLRNIPTRLFPAQSQLVFVSPLVDDDDVEVISLLRDRGYSILLVCPHASSWEARQMDAGPAAQLASRIQRLRHSLFLSSLARTGTRVVNWDVEEPLTVAIERDLGASFFRRHV